ncbi:LuxR family transcriptional regulator [Glaciihabitans arcticus]|uniref:LuxR family transcriptional regulator n=1 Tax=Glaciihabitans arcticus TaxID=2668039 RepID=A0A4Q9GZZ6_9MICO|nr:helix-turn-helix transcriptional regulator [Glaciihabitans arcticus]TBN57980.1 LuxR family transcriptional regulator [Glaciihabitans arcticus]
MTAALAAVEAGWGGHVWVGEPGSGKSLLLERTLDDIHQTGGCLVARLLVSDGPRALPLFTQRLHSLAGTSPRDGFPLGSTIVAVVDDFDSLEAETTAEVLALASTRAAGFVLLGTARTGSAVQPAPHPLVVSAVHPLDARETLHLLHDEEGLAVAPHVAALLAEKLAGNVGGILEMAAVLEPEQLTGATALPDPLPATPATTAVYGTALDALTPVERMTLLIAAVSVSRRTETLLAASGLELGELIGSAVADHVRFVAGFFEIADPRVRSLVHARASLAERTNAHERLAAASEPGFAEWHASLAALAGLPGIATPLIALARDALTRGDSAWAYDVAREASSQATGDDRLHAELTAGIAALQSGFVLDAVHWLGRVLRSDEAIAVRALGPYTIAVALAHGHVPDTDIEAWVAREPAALGVIGAAAAAAGLHAERGNVDAATRWLDTARTLAQADGTGADLVGLAGAWCSVFGIGEAPTETSSTPWLHGYLSVCAGLQLVREDDCDAAARVLATASLGLSRTGSDVAATPLLDAHLRVAGALASVGNGDFALAASAIEDAAFLAPVSLVFAGLGAATARRLAVLITGDVTTLAASLARIQPGAGSAAVRREALVDQAFAASFGGHSTEAAAFLSMACEQPARGIQLVLPAPDEVRTWLDADQRPRAEAAARRERGTSARLRASLALDPNAHRDDHWGRVIDEVRSVGNAWQRALTEHELGTAMTRAGDVAAGRPHLLLATEILFRSGAAALTAHARESSAGATTAPPEDWGATLTDREREVAALVVLGTSNRDVAIRLHLSVRTVEVHLARVFGKLDVHSRTELSYLVHGRGSLGSTT